MILITQSRLRSIFFILSRVLYLKNFPLEVMSFNFGSYLYISQMDLLRPRKKIDILRLMLSLLLSSHFHLFTSSFILLHIQHTLTFVLFIFLFFGKGARKIFHFRKKVLLPRRGFSLSIHFQNMSNIFFFIFDILLDEIVYMMYIPI